MENNTNKVNVVSASMIVEVGESTYEVIIHDSGDFDFNDLNGNVVTSDDVNFDVLTEFVQSLPPCAQ